MEGDACELDDLSFNWGDKRGFLVCNPPWGERMGEAHEIGDLYRRFGDTLAETFAADRKLLLLSEDAPLKALRQRVKQERWVNHGPHKVSLGRSRKQEQTLEDQPNGISRELSFRPLLLVWHIHPQVVFPDAFLTKMLDECELRHMS